MKILALIDASTTDLARLKSELASELRGSWELLKNDVLREAYATSSPNRVIFVLEAGSVEDARSHLDKLPLVAAGFMHIELIELRPFTNWSLLFAR